jgi:ATP-dependent Clp protease ATP-binding subunit ClpA
MDEMLRSRIIGQDEAVMMVTRAIETARKRSNDARRPLSAFLFLGPTGVGKTELARALAESLFGSESVMLNLDMSEFMEEASINRLVGPAPGYVGSEEGGTLTEWVRHKPRSVIVFDEMEMSHERISRLLLQVIEEGRLTDGSGNTVSFSETVIIVTSNLGAMHLAVPVLTDEEKGEAMEDIRHSWTFPPELLNRFDEIVMFNALSPEHLGSIMRLMLGKEVRRLEEQRGIMLTISEATIQWLLGQNNEWEYGARPLPRIIRRLLREPLADFLIKSDPPMGTEIKIGTAAMKKGGGLKFSAVINGQEVAVES